MPNLSGADRSGDVEEPKPPTCDCDMTSSGGLFFGSTIDSWFSAWLRTSSTQATSGNGVDADGTKITSLTSAEGATSIKDELIARIPKVNDAASFRKARFLLSTEMGGASGVGDELTFSGFIDTTTWKLTTNKAPFNIFARLGSGVQAQEGMDKEQKALGKYADKFVICRNKPEHDLYWDTTDEAWASKVSMSLRHRFLTTKDLSWEWFNCLVFGLVPSDMGGHGLKTAVEEVEAMKAAAMEYVKNSPGWSNDVGLFFNVFGHNNVNSLFLHIVDLSTPGPSLKKQAHKNCPLDDVLKVIREELEKSVASGGGGTASANPPSSQASMDRRQSMGGNAFFFSGTDGATSVKAEIVGRIPILRDAAAFREARRLLHDNLGGYTALLEELARAGLVDRETGKLTTGTRPFNVFARIAGGEMKQPGMEKDQEALGKYAEKFVVASNLPDNDDHWDSEDPAWVGKASMSQRHKFLTCKNLHWSWFNALVFGIVPPEEGGATLPEAIAFIEEMKAAALHYAKTIGGWSENVGLCFHVFGHCSVNSLHLHILDMEKLGPTYHKLSFKNCPIDAIIKVLHEQNASIPNRLMFQKVNSTVQKALEATQAVVRLQQSSIFNAEGANDSGDEILFLNVSGRPVCVDRRTLVMAPEGSVLHTLSGIDLSTINHSIDPHGRIYLDYPAEPFVRILDHLRIIRTRERAVRSIPPAPYGYQLDEVLELARVLECSSLFVGMNKSFPARWCCGTRRYRPPVLPDMTK